LKTRLSLQVYLRLQQKNMRKTFKTSGVCIRGVFPDGTNQETSAIYSHQLDESKKISGEYKDEQLSMNLDRVKILGQSSPRHCLPSARCAAAATTYGPESAP
jgi:hypothetical protein